MYDCVVTDLRITLVSRSCHVYEFLGREAAKCGPVRGQELLPGIPVHRFCAHGEGLQSQVHHLQERENDAVLARPGRVHLAELHGGL